MNNSGFIKIPREVIKDENFNKLKNSTKIVYLNLCFLFSKFGNKWFFYSISKMMCDTNLSKPTIIYAIKNLKKFNYILVKNDSYKDNNIRLSNKYFINYLG